MLNRAVMNSFDTNWKRLGLQRYALMNPFELGNALGEGGSKIDRSIGGEKIIRVGLLIVRLETRYRYLLKIGGLF